ncbi:MAG: helix-turn-helix domain-containing protein [Paracoccaceae bacterium]
MSVQYTVTVERTVDRVSNELVARNVTADQAIDLLLHIQANTTEAVVQDAEEETVEEAQEEPEQVPKDEPTAPPKKVNAPKKAGKPLNYDKDAIVADLRANMPVPEIAAKHKVTKQTVYNVKHRFLSEDEDSEPEAVKLPEGFGGETAYAQRQRERAAQKPEEKDIEQEIRTMVVEGLSISELELMFPTVELTKITSIYRDLRPIS